MTRKRHREFRRERHRCILFFKMALKYLENIVILFLQILMSLLHLLIHGAISDEQRPSLTTNHRQNSSTNGAGERLEASERDVNIPGFELATLLQKWTSYQKENVGTADDGESKRQVSNTKTNAKCFDEGQLQTTARTNGNHNQSSLKFAPTDSPLKRCNTAIGDESCCIEYEKRIDATEQLVKQNATTTSEVLVNDNKAAFQKNHSACRVEGKAPFLAMKRLDRTSSILSRIDNCLSKSKNTPLHHSMFPPYEGNTTPSSPRQDNGILKSEENSPALKYQTVTKCSDLFSTFPRLQSEASLNNFNLVAVQRQVSKSIPETSCIQDNASKCVKDSGKLQNENNLSYNLCESESLETSDRKEFITSGKRVNVSTNVDRNFPDDKLAATENNDPCNEDENEDFKEQLRTGNNVQISYDITVPVCIQSRNMLDAQADKQNLDTQGKDELLEEATGRSTENSNIKTDYAKADGETGEEVFSEQAPETSLSDTEVTDATNEESEHLSAESTHGIARRSNLDGNHSLADYSIYPSERRAERMDAMEFLMSLQRNTARFSERENQRDQNMAGTDCLEDDAIVAVGVGGFDVDRDRAGTGLARAAVDNHAAGGAGAGDNVREEDRAAVPQKRIKHRWRKYGNPNENPHLVRDRMYAVKRREKRQRYEA